MQYNRDFPPKIYLYANISLTYKIMSAFNMLYYIIYLM